MLTHEELGMLDMPINESEKLLHQAYQKTSPSDLKSIMSMSLGSIAFEMRSQLLDQSHENEHVHDSKDDQEACRN